MIAIILIVSRYFRHFYFDNYKQTPKCWNCVNVLNSVRSIQPIKVSHGCGR